MTLARWPLDLPADLDADGFEEAPQSAVIRTEVEAGPPHQRRQYTGQLVRLSGTLTLTRAEADRLTAFFLTDLAAGALPVLWQHPRTRRPARVRLIEPPVLRPIGSGAAYWRASLVLEILP